MYYERDQRALLHSRNFTILEEIETDSVRKGDAYISCRVARSEENTSAFLKYININASCSIIVRIGPLGNHDLCARSLPQYTLYRAICNDSDRNKCLP